MDWQFYFPKTGALGLFTGDKYHAKVGDNVFSHLDAGAIWFFVIAKGHEEAGICI